MMYSVLTHYLPENKKLVIGTNFTRTIILVESYLIFNFFNL